ncbi:response regulator transcription factor [Caulobacter segnis]|uniref:response regulator transcription factor n=1 Tax=Caulobacter segnis TaxID=88688 RepID=UPI00240FC641|nr:response regulator transcription factor [Caulobacter segnis]MDG2523495.1 response regulator transcription factor [Caulobacter segnis]
MNLSASATDQSRVFVVDDDASIRASLDSLLRSVGHKVETYGSALEFLQHQRQDDAACLVLDVRLPGISGLDFQAQLQALNIDLPIIFMTGHGDIPMTVRAMKAGAVDFLSKPFRDQDMLDAVAAAIERDRKRRREADAVADLRGLHAALTPREREVMVHVTAGLMNKQIAHLMGLSEITVKIHRGNMMRKMEAGSVADLVRMAEALGVEGPQA